MSDQVTYKSSGVDIDAGMDSLARIKRVVTKTHNTNVLKGLGSFGSLYDLSAIKNYDHPVLVQSVDGVGTKLMIARMMNRYDTVGADLVNHCCNDILCQGAKGISFLDYMAFERLTPEIVEGLVTGMANACEQNGVALVGGETAELPGIYEKGEFDLAGAITGLVEKSKMITGEKISKDDIIIGLASSGLHTNGYTLARKVFFDVLGLDVDSTHAELSKTVGEALLEVHLDYSTAVLPLLEKYDIKGIAHITGGGLIDNVPRILPANVSARFETTKWEIPPLFTILEKGGNVPRLEMFRSTNMGIGLILVVDEKDVSAIMTDIKEHSPVVIGDIIEGDGRSIIG